MPMIATGPTAPSPHGCRRTCTGARSARASSGTPRCTASGPAPARRCKRRSTNSSARKGEFDGFGWRDDPDALRAWQRGRTGYPLVDAGMRELWATGWMHNRVRMVAASFLVKHLLVDWRAGADWFWDTLVDADLANNAASWQWVAGCGADAAPYFRIFNPVAQGEKFDPDASYIRRWVPELARLPDAYVHRPWDAPVDVCRAAGFLPGESYPSPVVDHAAARGRALAAYQAMRGG
jgi:deoxyribodipyrimidine photo-lyase